MKALLRAIADRVIGKTPKLIKRSGQWPRVRKEFLKKNTFCAVCVERDPTMLEVHHIVPFHEDRSLELEPKNLITLCSEDANDCHFVFGHNGNWKKCNPAMIKIKEQRLNWLDAQFWDVLGWRKQSKPPRRS